MYYQDNGSGRYEAVASAQEHDGEHRGRQEQAGPLLHLHPEHHPGRGGPYSGPQESSENQREETCKFHSMGPGLNPG